ncbi:MAG: LamG domain-containing protein, partial [Gammaproteobacteria bacterium]|nr:LamG domain-containing protein [Gammaproteobacteria bacterium]
MTLPRLLAASLLMLSLYGCGDSATTTENPITILPPVDDYLGPAAATADVQAFRLELWENIRDNNRCGACHGAGGQTPMFARNDDVNLAYEAANTVVNLMEPDTSLLVTKVEGGHNCWLSSDAACGDILTTWITNWAGDALAGGGREIDLEAPPDIEIGTSKAFPADSSLFGLHVHPVLTEYCAGCHASDSLTAQSPYFADADVDAAYDAAKTKINLDEPAESRFVVRLRSEFHNCWDDCADNAQEMEDAIEAMAFDIPLTEVDEELVTSKALTLLNGLVASGGNRYESNAIATYEFKTGSGTTAFDTSGIEPGLNLTLSGDVTWVGGWGINIRDGKAQGTTTASKKLHDLIKATDEYAIEAWVVPANVTQEEANIVSYSGGQMARNFTLGQTLYNYDFFNRSTVTDGNGEPAHSTADADEDLQAALQHVVVNYDPINGREIYVNGVFTDDVDALIGGTLDDWDDTFAFVLGNEVSNDGLWQGILRMVVVHNRIMTQEQITQNFDAGVGEKFFLLFNVSDLV